jgi:hypothetical protein
MRSLSSDWDLYARVNTAVAVEQRLHAVEDCPVDEALGKTLYVPIRGIIGAELVSVDVGLCNIGAVALNVILGCSTTVLTNFLGGSIDFGEVTVAVNGGESVVTNVPLVDPQPPHSLLPFLFDIEGPNWLRVRTGGAGVLFTWARLNYKRKRLAV